MPSVRKEISYLIKTVLIVSCLFFVLAAMTSAAAALPVAASPIATPPSPTHPAKNFWVSGYYPGWIQEKLPPEKIRMDAITHLFHFAAAVHPDGSLALSDFILSDSHIKATIKAAHGAGKKILIVLGGANSGAGFRGATSQVNRDKFIASIVALVAGHGYDGVDLDWEPLLKADNEQYKAFVLALRAALKQQNGNALLTAATGPDPFGNPEVGQLYTQLQESFDQINLMTYVLSGAWLGWISWYGSPLYNGGGKFPGGRALPSIESNMANFVAAGVLPPKLGIGIAFHGDVWSGGAGTTTGGVTGPRQEWKTPPTVKNDVAFSEVMEKFYALERAHFDEVAQTPYLSIDRPGGEDDRFVSYSDVTAVKARLEFMQKKGFGGCIIWHLGQDSLPLGKQPLSEAVARFLTAP
jgi:chitinase